MTFITTFTGKVQTQGDIQAANVVTSGTVDGVDVSDFKNDYDEKVNQDLKSSASPQFQDLTLAGNLVVNGVATTVNTQNMSVKDTIV